MLVLLTIPAGFAMVAVPVDHDKTGTTVIVAIIAIASLLALFFGVLILQALRRSVSRPTAPGQPSAGPTGPAAGQPDPWREAGRRLRVEPDDSDQDSDQ